LSRISGICYPSPIPAIFENGAFRPEQPVDIRDGVRGSLTVNVLPAVADDLSDVASLLDADFIEACRHRAGKAPPWERVRAMLGAYRGLLAELICEEREDR
jgi:predicted DNA-binding antitoxin AbrB/MazE fold protein